MSSKKYKNPFKVIQGDHLSCNIILLFVCYRPKYTSRTTETENDLNYCAIVIRLIFSTFYKIISFHKRQNNGLSIITNRVI